MDILVLVDGSKHSQWALEWAARMPLSAPIRLTALHVVDIVSLRAPLAPHPIVVWNEAFIQAETERLEAEGRAALAKTKEQMSSLDLKGKVIVEKGSVVPTILKRARKRGSLIVMGSRGLSTLDRFVLGSVSTRIVHHAPCSVLIAKEPARAFKRVLVAVDGSKESAKALQFIRRNLIRVKMQSGGPADAIEVVAIHVMPFLRYPELKEAGKAIVDHAVKQLEKAGFRAEGVAKLGDPADEIITHAESHDVDLIVAGARGLGAVARVVLGSVSTKLLHHSPRTLLIIR